MPIVLLFTAMIVISLLTRSVAIVGLCGVIIGIVLLVQRLPVQKVIVYLLSMLSGVGSILIYDMNHTSGTFTLSGTTTFRVREQQRINRYLIEVKSGEREGKDYSTQQFLLYSTLLLQPGDIIQSNRNIVARNYKYNWCMLLCDDGLDIDRQYGQVMDSESFDYDAWLYMQGLNGSLYDNNPYIVGYELLSKRMQLRQYIKHNMITRLGSDTVGALGLGMLIGDRSLFHKDEYQSFIDSGLVHLVAVSGGNIAIMVALASLLLFWLPFYIRIVVLILVVIGYSYLVGTDSSVIRATIMALLTLFALLPGRQISIWRLLAYAWVLMLLRNPYYLLYDLGFLLSFGALLGILRADKVVFKKLKSKIAGQSDEREVKKFSSSWWKVQLWNAFRIIIIPSVGAMVGVLPILIGNTGQINLLSPLLNILIVPFVPLITCLLVIISMIDVSFVSRGIGWILDCITQLSQRGSSNVLLLEVYTLGSWIVGGVLCLYWLRWMGQETSPRK